jgi:hypothetical protein
MLRRNRPWTASKIFPGLQMFRGIERLLQRLHAVEHPRSRIPSLDRLCTIPAAATRQFLSIVMGAPQHLIADAGILDQVEFRLVLHRGCHDEVYRRQRRDNGASGK